MSECIWEIDGEGVTCVKCREQRDFARRRSCPAGDPWASFSERKQLLAEIIAAEPSLLTAARQYSLAVLRWIKAGRPTRNQAEIEAALAICRGCEFYTETDRPRCKQCGCSVNNSSNGLANKIAMATEQCPLPEPKW